MVLLRIQSGFLENTNCILLWRSKWNTCYLVNNIYYSALVRFFPSFSLQGAKVFNFKQKCRGYSVYYSCLFYNHPHCLLVLSPSVSLSFCFFLSLSPNSINSFQLEYPPDWYSKNSNNFTDFSSMQDRKSVQCGRQK